MYNNSEEVFEELNHAVYWIIAIFGLYLWGIVLCCVGGIRQGTLENFNFIAAQKENLVCSCTDQEAAKNLLISPPTYAQLYGDKLPSYNEALLMMA